MMIAWALMVENLTIIQQQQQQQQLDKQDSLPLNLFHNSIARTYVLVFYNNFVENFHYFCEQML